MPARLSVAIITHNEAANIEACLRSVSWADEVVVLDHASSDETVARSRAAGARVIEAPDWPGFGVQKNRAVDACTSDWILSLDADERISLALKEEIDDTLAAPRFDVYELPRRSTYCGRFIRHSGWWPDYTPRLFRRGVARFSEALVHERLQSDRPMGRLREPLIHFTYRSMEQVIDKMNRYSSDSATMLTARGATPGLGTAIGHGLAAFIRSYIVRRGFLDGRYGFMLAVSNAEGSYYRYIKAMLAREKAREDIER